MNRKQFEIWKAQREREFSVELENTRNDFASRGLASSGFRNQAEQNLRARYDAESEMKRLEMEEVETQKISWFPNSNWRPFVLSTAVSIIVGIVVYYLTK